MRTRFLAYVPFTGLGLFGGFRGNRWLRNRIKVFKQFVVPSLLNQSDRDFTLWISWRPEERGNPYVIELEDWLHRNTNLVVVFTFGGLCFYDDKYEDSVAKERMALALHYSMPELLPILDGFHRVAMMLQPSDDLYNKNAVKDFNDALKEADAATYLSGYMMNYPTKELREYNPKTNPPFFAYAMPKEVFIDPISHMNFTGPYQSHEYIGDKMKLKYLTGRGFIVGTHGENISTYFDNPFGGEFIKDIEHKKVLELFGLLDAPNLVLPWTPRKWILRKIGHRARRKLRYLWGEKIYNRVYNYLRN